MTVGEMIAKEEREESEVRERFKTFKPDEIPATIERTIYVCYGVGKYNHGRIEFEDSPPPAIATRGLGGRSKPDTDFSRVLLTKFRVTVEIPQGIDVQREYIAILEDAKRAIKNEARVKIQHLQKQIDGILKLPPKALQLEHGTSNGG